MSYQNTFNIPDAVKGDTFVGIEFTLTVNAILSDLTGAVIKMQLKESNSSTALAVLTFDNDLIGGITIIDAENGVFQIDSQVIDIPALCYFYDIQITYPNGDIKTYIRGRWTILPEVTT